MFTQAVELHSLWLNVMIKIPGTAEGYEVIKKLTAWAIPTNNTLSFIIPQFVACMNAVVEGINEARSNGLDLSKWRSVITAMSARYGTLGDLRKEAGERGIELTEADVRWAEIVIFKKACHLVEENSDYLGKMRLPHENRTLLKLQDQAAGASFRRALNYRAQRMIPNNRLWTAESRRVRGFQEI